MQIINNYWTGGGGGYSRPYMGYMGMCGPKGYGFSAVFVINRVSILAILVINWVSSFALVLNSSFLEEATSSSCLPPSIRRKVDKYCLQHWSELEK